jgi:hypothetical protein
MKTVSYKGSKVRGERGERRERGERGERRERGRVKSEE